jgi:hypothetical protein
VPDIVDADVEDAFDIPPPMSVSAPALVGSRILVTMRAAPGSATDVCFTADRLPAKAPQGTPPRRSAALGVAVGALAVAVGCGGHEPSEPAPDLASCQPPPPLRSEPIAGALEIGTGGPHDFRASSDGDEAEIVLGSQGGYMAVPVFRVDPGLMGTDGACAYLSVHVEVTTLDPVDYEVRLPNSTPTDPYWYFGTLPLFLASNPATLVGQTATYAATFRDDGKAASDAVSVVLVNND